MWPSHPITSHGTCLMQTPWFASSSGFFLGQPPSLWYHHSPEPWHKTSFLHPTFLCLPSPLILPSHPLTSLNLLIPEASPFPKLPGHFEAGPHYSLQPGLPPGSPTSRLLGTRPGQIAFLTARPLLCLSPACKLTAVPSCRLGWVILTRSHWRNNSHRNCTI